MECAEGRSPFAGSLRACPDLAEGVLLRYELPPFLPGTGPGPMRIRSSRLATWSMGMVEGCFSASLGYDGQSDTRIKRELPTELQCKNHTTLAVEDRAGQRYCYNCIIETHQTRAQNLALRMLGDWATAEDATQEAFLAGYRAFPGFRGENLRAWLLRIVANTCRDMLRARKSRPSISLDFSPLNPDEPDSPAIDLPGSEESPEDYTVRRELGRVIQEGLLALPEERRLAVALVDVQGFSYEEAAQVMNCSLGTVKSRMARGRAEMRDFLQRHRELLPGQFRQDK